MRKKVVVNDIFEFDVQAQNTPAQHALLDASLLEPLHRYMAEIVC